MVTLGTSHRVLAAHAVEPRRRAHVIRCRRCAQPRLDAPGLGMRPSSRSHCDASGERTGTSVQIRLGCGNLLWCTSNRAIACGFLLYRPRPGERTGRKVLVDSVALVAAIFSAASSAAVTYRVVKRQWWAASVQCALAIAILPAMVTERNPSLLEHRVVLFAGLALFPCLAVAAMVHRRWRGRL